MNIELHIERLVIDQAWMAGEQPARVRSAIERELALRLSAPGALSRRPTGGAMGALPAVVMPPPGPSHDRLAGRVASAVHTALDGGLRRG